MTQQPSESVPINDGRYGAHWGLSDLYPDSLTRLKGALSGGDMRTDWWGSRKEIAWARVRRENGHVTVDVRSQMDSSDELLHGAYLTLTAPPSVQEGIQASGYRTFEETFFEQLRDGQLPQNLPDIFHDPAARTTDPTFTAALAGALGRPEEDLTALLFDATGADISEISLSRTIPDTQDVTVVLTHVDDLFTETQHVLKERFGTLCRALNAMLEARA